MAFAEVRAGCTIALDGGAHENSVELLHSVRVFPKSIAVFHLMAVRIESRVFGPQRILYTSCLRVPVSSRFRDSPIGEKACITTSFKIERWTCKERQEATS